MGGGGCLLKCLDYVLFSPRLLDVAAALRMGATPHAAGLSRVERSPVTKHRELPTISVSKSGSTSSKSDATNVTAKSDTHLSPHKSSTHEVRASLCKIMFNYFPTYMQKKKKYIYIYIYIYMYMFVCVCVCVCIYIYRLLLLLSVVFPHPKAIYGFINGYFL